MMFEGERESLLSILATETVRCCTPLEVVDHPDGSGAIFILDHLELRDLDQQARELGRQMASLHLHNIRLKAEEEKCASTIGFFDRREERGVPRFEKRFGFGKTTCCGVLPLENTWTDDWTPRFRMIEYDREVTELWSEFMPKISKFLPSPGTVTPSLLHGDLHMYNMAETDSGPVMYDPASMYGHHEYEFARSTSVFPDLHSEFLSAYHEVIPKTDGFEKRQKLYRLFFYLNKWYIYAI
ncbi:ketosamine-3-kinase-like [Diadema antillarum]|uniref:ketosamine-3-kinase-like n=1 Tax=Diadema antillarum TaxID=105358 RepID=UPI003A85AB2A